MNWFDKQIKQRQANDDAVLRESLAGITDAVLGTNTRASIREKDDASIDAASLILDYFKIDHAEIPESIKDFDKRLEYLLKPNGVMYRTVLLERGWYKNSAGPILATRKDSEKKVALLPAAFGGYYYLEEETGKKIKLSAKNQNDFCEEAMCFYRPFPLTEITFGVLLRYIKNTLNYADYILLILVTAIITAIGLLFPVANKLLMGRVIESGSIQLLISVAIFAACTAVCYIIFGAAKTLILSRIQTKMGVEVEAATIMRTLSLPADFFNEYGSGELANRIGIVQSICSNIVNAVLTTGLTALFSLIYIPQISAYAKGLVVPSIAVILISFVFTVISSLCQMKYIQKRMELSAKESGMSYSLITGIQKIKLAGAEKRAYARWAEVFEKQLRATYNLPLFLKANAAFASIISLGGVIAVYFFAVKSNVSVADYYAFNSVYAMLTGAFTALSGIAGTIATIKPEFKLVKPFLDAAPEISEGKTVIEKLNGGLELDNISFCYDESMPNVIDRLSLKIKAGEYVGIVGTTGCGKSTLMRIMLGFEKPQKGAVYYDGKNIEAVDIRSLRQKIGTVLQDGKLFLGDIYSNIVLSAPQLSMDDAWEAARLAGIAEDIENMPMGMFTLISEGSGGISGGQRQRILIARAIAPKPSVLFFDEATSALDNITQKKITDALAGLKCTRVVIAHRLSTIQECDRIIVLDKGNIAESGTYDELIAKNGIFAELVNRQRLDIMQ